MCAYTQATPLLSTRKRVCWGQQPVCQKIRQAPSGSPLSGQRSPQFCVQTCGWGGATGTMSFFKSLSATAGKLPVGCAALHSTSGSGSPSPCGNAAAGSVLPLPAPQAVDHLVEPGPHSHAVSLPAAGLGCLLQVRWHQLGPLLPLHELLVHDLSLALLSLFRSFTILWHMTKVIISLAIQPECASVHCSANMSIFNSLHKGTLHYPVV